MKKKKTKHFIHKIVNYLLSLYIYIKVPKENFSKDIVKKILSFQVGKRRRQHKSRAIILWKLTYTTQALIN